MLEWYIYIAIVVLCVSLLIAQKYFKNTQKNSIIIVMLLFVQYMSIAGGQEIDGYSDISNYPIETVFGMYIFSVFAIVISIYSLLKKIERK